MQATGDGCRCLIARWGARAQQLRDAGHWDLAGIDEAPRLLGAVPDSEALGHDVTAYLTLVYGIRSHPVLALGDLAIVLGAPENRPAELRGVEPSEFLPADPSECRELLLTLIAEELGELRAEEERLRTGPEEDERRELVEDGRVLRAGEPARLFLRYRGESRTGFQRAYKGLLSTLDRDAIVGSATDDDRPASAAGPGAVAAPEAIFAGGVLEAGAGAGEFPRGAKAAPGAPAPPTAPHRPPPEAHSTP